MSETTFRRSNFGKRLSDRLEEGTDQVFKAWKTQARRPDRVGEVSYRGLELVHGGLEIAVRSLTHLEKVTALPHRPPKPRPHTEEPERTAHAAEAHARRSKPAPVHTTPAHRPGRGERHEPEVTAS